jgi:hypothetical protein
MRHRRSGSLTTSEPHSRKPPTSPSSPALVSLHGRRPWVGPEVSTVARAATRTPRANLLTRIRSAAPSLVPGLREAPGHRHRFVADPQSHTMRSSSLRAMCRGRGTITPRSPRRFCPFRFGAAPSISSSVLGMAPWVEIGGDLYRNTAAAIRCARDHRPASKAAVLWSAWRLSGKLGGDTQRRQWMRSHSLT